MSAHLLKRMEDRGFNEVDVRRMLERAMGHVPDVAEERFVVAARHLDKPSEVIVEPDEVRRLLVVITAYPVEQTPGFVVDFTAEDQAIGIEITAPTKATLAGLNAILTELGEHLASEVDLAPVLAA